MTKVRPVDGIEQYRICLIEFVNSQKWKAIQSNARQRNTQVRQSYYRRTGNTSKQSITLTEMQQSVCNILDHFGLDSPELTEDVGFESTIEDNSSNK